MPPRKIEATSEPPESLLELDLPSDGETVAALVRSGSQPFVIRGGAAQWPAIVRWTDEYLAEVAGNVRVQIRPAADYRAGKSTREKEGMATLELRQLLSLISSGKPPALCYAREAKLLREIPSLMRDLNPPALLAESRPHAQPRTGSSGAVAWIGPAQTQAQLHWDPEHNIFAQIRGRKLFTVAPPTDASRAYPVTFSVKQLGQRSFFASRGAPLFKKIGRARSETADELGRQSAARFRARLARELSPEDLSILCDFLLDVNNFHVDAETPDSDRHTRFARVRREQAVLEVGDLIFIPRFWLHAVRALDASISVNWFFLQARHGKSLTEGWISDILLAHLRP